MDKNAEYQKMNASEKTKFLGFKHYSEKELKEKTAASEKRGVELFRELFTRLIALPNLRLGKHLTEKDLEAVFAETLNNFYQWAVDNGYTGRDMTNMVDNIISISYLINRLANQNNTEATRFNYAFTGQNELSDLPIKNLLKLIDIGLEARPDEPVVLDDEKEEESVDNPQ